MKRLNYTTQFLDDASSHSYTKQFLTGDPEEGEILLRLLRESQKFMLPDKGHLLYGPGGIPEGVEITRLPYPVIAIETTWEYDRSPEHTSFREKTETIASSDTSRRIVLAFEVGRNIYDYTPKISTDGSVIWEEKSILHSAPAAGDRINDPVGYAVVSAFRSDQAKSWAVSGGAFFVPYEQDISQANDFDSNNEHHKANTKLHKHAGAKLAVKQMKSACSPAIILPDLFRRTYGTLSQEDQLSYMMNDLGEEMRMVIELTSALSCSNVKAMKEEPISLLQKQRTRKKKAPLFGYHVLMVNGQTVGDHEVKTGDGGHESPRTHLRRGHLRRLPHREERIWINDTIVNPGNGFAAKDYRVR